MSTSWSIIPVLVAEPSKVARLRASLGDRVCPYETGPQLLSAVRSSQVEFVVVSPCDSRGESMATTVAAIRASRRSAPVHIYSDRSPESIRALMALARVGATGVILADIDDDARSLKRMLERGTVARCVEAVTLAIRDIVARRHLPLLLCCLEMVDDTRAATELARRLHVSRRTLSAWSRQIGARGVRALSSQCRVLVAIEMLRETGRTVEQVAHALRFSSSAHLHNTMRRYTGVRPREALARDTTSWCSQLFGCAAMPPRESRLPVEESTERPNDTILPP